jgi:acetyltransferase-like isoleucine patch superfamily enzyme
MKFRMIERISPNVVIDMDRKSKIEFGNRVSIHSDCRISSVEGGHLTIRGKTSLNVRCIITCHHKIEIGENVSIGPNVMIFDHDHVMKGGEGVKHTAYRLDEITIGNNSWIGAGAIILKGTHIGENCIIAAGSIVKGDVPTNTIFMQKRENTYLKVNE